MSKTETGRLCVGVDLHKTQFTVCALSEDGEYLLEKKYPTKEEGYRQFTSEMHNREEQGYSIELAVETTGNARFFKNRMEKEGFVVKVVNTNRFKVITTSTKKTDANDAATLAYYLMKEMLPEAHLCSQTSEEIRRLLKTRRRLFMKRILIYGWYGENNYGDELLLKSILNILSPYQSTIQINVMGSNPKQILKNHSGIYRVSKTFFIEPRKIISTIIKDPINTVINLYENDVLIVAGGGAISDWNLTSTREMFFLINHFFSKDKPVYLLGVGAGPISNKESYAYFCSTLSKAKEITTRDEYSYSELKKIGLDNVKIGKDLSYYSDIDSSECEIPKKIKNIGIVLAPVCMKTKDVYDTLVSESRKLISELVKNYNVSLIPFQYNYDYEMMKQVSDEIADINILYDMDNIWSIEKYIYSQDLIIGMRYHSLVLSALLNKYIIPIVYHPKNWSFCEDYDLTKYSESVGNGENWRKSNISSKHIIDSINIIAEDDKYWGNLSMGLQKKKISTREKTIIKNIIEG